MSRWQDVRWDWHAAREAVGKLRQMAALIDAVSGQQARAAHELLQEWQGPRQREWAARHAAVQAEACRLRERCLQAARAIEQASDRARAEQDRIDRERAAAQQRASYDGQ